MIFNIFKKTCFNYISYIDFDGTLKTNTRRKQTVTHEQKKLDILYNKQAKAVLP